MQALGLTGYTPLNTEPPVLGAPVLFELLRSYNILNPTNQDVHLFSGSTLTLGNSGDSSTNLTNPTFYKGFYYRPHTSGGTAQLNFSRSSLLKSNPYIFLSEDDIKRNARGLEQSFTSIRDTAKIKSAIDEYWNRIISYDTLSNAERNPLKGKPLNTDVNDKYQGYYPGFHLIYPYMMENTKMFQIFERLITSYRQGEDLTIPYNLTDFNTSPWIENTYQLFFSNSPNSIWSQDSTPGSTFEAMRRNGYHRLFGMDLNHGIGESNTTPVPYKRANHFNTEFIPQFESFLKLCWQMMINFSNTSNINTTDLIALQEQANSLKNMLLARRTTENNLDNYTLLNLSKLEYHAVVMAEWFNHAISYNSPIVREMSAEGVTASERLSRLGQRVGIPVHSKASNFLDLAPLMATLLRLFELDEVDNDYLTAIANSSTRPYALITSIIHNYQLATGRDIKNQVMMNNRNLMLNRMVNA